MTTIIRDNYPSDSDEQNLDEVNFSDEQFSVKIVQKKAAQDNDMGLQTRFNAEV